MVVMILHEPSFGLTLIDLVDKKNTKSIGENKPQKKKRDIKILITWNLSHIKEKTT